MKYFLQFLFVLYVLVVLLSSGAQSQAVGRNLQLTWTDNTNKEDGFKIERMLGRASSWSEIAQVGIDVTAYTDAAPDNQLYCYRVFAFNISSTSGPSNVACDPDVSVGVITPGESPDNLTIRRVP